MIEERDGANTLKARYVYGNNIDEPVEIERAGAGGMVSYLPMQDTNGNIIGLADSTGKLIEKTNYSAYGQPIFIYDHVAPQVDQVRVADGKVTIRFSEPVDQTSAKSAIRIKQGTNDLAGAITFAEDDEVAVFTPGSTLPNAALTITITTDLEDKNGNKLAAEFSQDFTYAGVDLLAFDRVVPEVEKITLLSGKLHVAFSEELDPAAIANAIGLTYATGTINGVSTLADAKTILFTPSSSLTNSTEYTITVKSTIKDLSGKAPTSFSEKFIHSGSDLLIYQKPDPTKHTESYVKNTALFQGREFDPETGLYYFRARYLHPELGRFLQTDPKGFVDSMNPYQSFGNNPVNFSDPMGTITDFNFAVPREEIEKARIHNQNVGDLKTDLSILLAGITAPLISVNYAFDKGLDAIDIGYRTFINPIASSLGIEDLVAEEGEIKKAADFAMKVIPFIEGGRALMALNQSTVYARAAMENTGINTIEAYNGSFVGSEAGSIRLMNSTVSGVIPDEAFVHVTTKSGANKILSNGLDPDITGYVTKGKYVKVIEDPSIFNTKLYKQSYWPKTAGRFNEGAYVLKISAENPPTYYSPFTNSINGLPQWLFKGDIIPPNKIELIKIIGGKK